ncbi:hypothetical protein HZS_5640 [Henneguya salminicola]|nr:hypothetical protein HZS_5640 [Henneguya salminicola]
MAEWQLRILILKTYFIIIIINFVSLIHKPIGRLLPILPQKISSFEGQPLEGNQSKIEFFHIYAEAKILS